MFYNYLHQNGTKRGGRQKAAALFWKRPKAASILGQIIVKMVSEGTFLFDFGIFRRRFFEFPGVPFWACSGNSRKGSRNHQIARIFIEKDPTTIKIPTSGVFENLLL